MAYIQRLHHVSLHVSHADRVARELVSKFRFRPFASRDRDTSGYRDTSRQLALRKGRAVFVLSDRTEPGTEEPRNHGDGVNRDPRNHGDGVNREPRDHGDGVNREPRDHGDGLYGVNGEPRNHGDGPNREPRNHGDGVNTEPRDHGDGLYGAPAPYGVDTVSDVCFEVRDVHGSFQTLTRAGCSFLVSPTCVRDDRGEVTYAVVRSVVGNVCHTLIDKSRYDGGFLPGFQLLGEEGEEPEDEACPVTHFDHVTYVCPRSSTHGVLQWYENKFGFKRFYIGSNDDPEEGLVLDQDGIGLRLAAMQYWKCSQTGLTLPSVHQGEPDCKFVIAESLPEQGHNQVDRFLEQHRGPGVQHIGLYTSNILSTAETMSTAGVSFYCPPQAYYTEEEKQQQICASGLSSELLSRFGILLDTDTRTEEGQLPRFLLQVFSKPLFSEDTFFLELIERRGASGFGEGNIRALWRSVQKYMEEKQEEEEQQEEDQEEDQEEEQEEDQEEDQEEGQEEDQKLKSAKT